MHDTAVARQLATRQLREAERELRRWRRTAADAQAEPGRRTVAAAQVDYYTKQAKQQREYLATLRQP
jgi:hypothetical protein